VLANLLSNASRHTPAGTVVTVSLESTEPAATRSGPGAAVVSVTDNGPGIPAELQAAVFERFVRGDTSRSRAAGSSGLGLAIVHAVTAAHGGTAHVASRPGETRFTIELPIADESSPPSPNPALGAE
jgi:two-component system OmpR family sensor kinase